MGRLVWSKPDAEGIAHEPAARNDCAHALWWVTFAVSDTATLSELRRSSRPRLAACFATLSWSGVDRRLGRGRTT